MTSKAEELVLRTARLLWKMGYFVRMDVPLSAYNPYSDSIDRRDITDLDVLGIRWDADFVQDNIVCECKSGTSVKTIDRVIWLKGVMSYTGARKSYLVSSKGGPIACSVGQKLGVTVIDQKLLSTLENQFDMKSDEWVGSISPTNYRNNKEMFEKATSVLKPEATYLRYTYWIEPEHSQIKKLLKIGEYLSTIEIKNNTLREWLLVESIILFSLSLVNFCGKFYTSVTRDLPIEVSAGLFGGYMSRLERRGMIDDVYSFLKSYVKSEYNDSLPFTSKQMRTLEPVYFENLVSLMERMISSSVHNAVPRFLDYLFYTNILEGQKIDVETLKIKFPEFDVFFLAKASKNIVKFFLETTGEKSDLFKPLLEL